MGGLLHSEIDVDQVGEIGERLLDLSAQQMLPKNYAGFNERTNQTCLDNSLEKENKHPAFDIYSPGKTKTSSVVKSALCKQACAATKVEKTSGLILTMIPARIA
jgi:hypothetical protein